MLLGLVSVVAVLIPSAPWPGAPLGTDQGVFLYTGNEILIGSIPYRDVWDHKPPVIFYINALGLLIAGGSQWGVWALEVLSLYLAALLSFATMSKAFGEKIALFGTGMWLVSFPLLLPSGNLTEEFALPFQFAAVYLFVRPQEMDQDTRQPSRLWYLLGAVIALTLLVKQNLIGIGISIVLVLLWSGITRRNWHDLYRKLASVSFGAVAIFLPVALYFAAHGALLDLWDAAFLYNFSYVIEGPIEARIWAITTSIDQLAPSGILFLAFLGWLSASYLWRISRPLPARQAAVFAVSLVDLPIELLSSSISARPLVHYYIAWLPVLGLLSAIFAYSIPTLIRRVLSRNERIMRRAATARLWPLILLMVMVFHVASRVVPAAYEVIVAPAWNPPVVEYLSAATTSSDYVLIWGVGAGYNFLASRRSPTKYVYQWPLYQSDYVRESHIKGLLRDLEARPPRLIVDTSTTFPVVPPIDPSRRLKWQRPQYQAYTLHPNMDEVLAFIWSNYRYAGKINNDEWYIYAYSGP